MTRRQVGPSSSLALALAVALALALGLAVGARAARGEPRPYGGVTLEGRLDSDAPGPGGADLVSRIAPRLGVLAPGPRAAWALDVQLALQVYALGATAPTADPRAAAGARARLTRRLAVEAALVALRAEDPALLDRPGVLLPEGTVTEAAGAARLSFRADRRATLEGAIAFRLTRFDGPVGAEALDADGGELRADGALAYRVTRRLDARGFARAAHLRDREAAQSVGAAGAGAAWRATRRIDLRVAGGPALFLDGARPSWVAAAAAVWSRRRDRAVLSTERELLGGTGAGTALWTETVRLDVRRRLSRRAEARLAGWFGRSGAAPDGDARTRNLAGRAELRWRLGARLALAGHAEHRAQDRADAARAGELRRTVVGVALLAVTGVGVADLAEAP